MNSIKKFGTKYSAIKNILTDCEEYIIDRDGIIVSSNLESVSVTGYEEWEVIGKHFSMFYTQQDYLKDKFSEDVKLVEKMGRMEVDQLMKKRKNASFWARVILEKLTNSNSERNVYKLKLKDNTHSVLMNIQFSKIQEEFENLFNSSFIGIARFRFSNGELVLINQRGMDILARTEQGPFVLADIFENPTDYKHFKKLLVRERKVDSFEFVLKQVEKKKRWGSLTCCYFSDEDVIEVVLQDVTEKRNQILDLERLNNEFQMFIYRSSHDLRGPLTSIMGLTNMISLEYPSQKVLEYNSMISRRIRDIDSILKSMVSIAFNSSSTIEYDKINFSQEVDYLIEEFKEQYQNVEINVTIDTAFTIITDVSRVRIVLRNLLANAVHFHAPESTFRNVFVKISAVNSDKFKVIIEDNGVGIEDSVKDYIFNMFYRGSNVSTGAGLGLYIVKTVVDKLGGEIELPTKPKVGTTFCITLPNNVSLIESPKLFNTEMSTVNSNLI